MNPNLNVFSLKGKVVVVTGGARRYGRCFCTALAEAGGTVIVTSRDKSRADESAAQYAARGLAAFGHALDQSDDASIEALVISVLKEHGKIDVLINNARTLPQMPPGETDRAEFDRLFTVNAVGVILLTRRVVEEMKKAGGGNIVNIGSIYGMVGQDLSIYEHPESKMSWDYPLLKGGMIALTRQLAACLGRYNIRSNCLSLGGLRETAPNDAVFLNSYNKRTPLGRMAEPEDVRGPIVFLASDASAYMTGANLVVDGGWTAW